MTAAAPEADLVDTEPTDAVPADAGDVLADVLIEEISIDGMCGVY